MASETPPLEIRFEGPEPAASRLVLAHGAGAPMDSPFMDAISAGLAGAGVRVARFEFPYMRRRRVGGGRLLQAACRYFQQGIGVDVHGHQELVNSLLEARGVTNVQLHQTDGRSIPLGEAEVDFIYSFIVYQHLADVEALRQNLREAARVPRSDTVAP